MTGDRRSVCAVVPHFACEAWLGHALESLLGQSRPPDSIVVLDDASPEPPVDIVRQHPEVTLLAAADNGGPYRLVQAAIDGSDHDFYLFQDADDWSAPERLEVLLDESEATGAELIGSHELRVLAEVGDVVAVRYPLDVNAALAEDPAGFPLLHPTSMVARDLVVRLGGFATGMRFSGDAELLRRAAHVARVANADHFAYFRRKRAGSLTTAPGTAHHSADRLAVQATLTDRAQANAAARARGHAPDLRPLRRAPLPALQHLAGPALGSRAARHARIAWSPPPRPHDPAPVLLVGAPRAGQSFLAWALDQHPAFAAIPDPRWLAAIIGDVERRAGDDASPPPPGFCAALRREVAKLAAPRPGRRWLAGGIAVTDALDALSDAFPSARVLHLVRAPGEVVADLAARPTDAGVYHSPDRAWRGWLAGARAGLAAERRLGPERVLRVRHADLVADPHATLARCVAFLGEADDAAAQRALSALAPERLPKPPPCPPDIVDACRRLDHLLAAAHVPDRPGTGTDVDPDPLLGPDLAGEPPCPGGRPLVERLRQLVVDAVPAGATVLVASKGDPRLLAIDGRTAWHFPRMPNGVYAGHHPADSGAAVIHLGELRARGADHLVVPSAAFWWLDHYQGLRRHLDERHAVVAFHEEVGLVYRLAGERARSGALASPPPRLVVDTAPAAPARAAS